MISSKVNQWTLLVGALPLAFSLASGGVREIALDMRQREEIFLTAAQSVFGLVVISNYRFAVHEAGILFGLFALQLVFTSPESRWVYAGVYLALSGVLLLRPGTRRACRALLARRRG